MKRYNQGEGFFSFFIFFFSISSLIISASESSIYELYCSGTYFFGSTFFLSFSWMFSFERSSFALCFVDFGSYVTGFSYFSGKKAEGDGFKFSDSFLLGVSYIFLASFNATLLLSLE